jgi:Na+-translocating ferredoxin:NAD+ oxidoreductase RnfC subunit
MSEKIKEIISSIKEDNPDVSAEELEKAVIDCIESNLPEIVAKIKLPSLKDLRIPFRKGMYRQARSQVKSEKLREDISKTELVCGLTAIQEQFSDRGLKEDADRVTKHIKDIEAASISKKETLMYASSDLSEWIKREETAEEDRSRTTRKLEELGDDVNE